MKLKACIAIFSLWGGITLAKDVSNLDLVKAFDGRSASCQTQDDYIRVMRTGAYIISGPTVKMNDDRNFEVALDVTSLRCLKKDENSFAWEVITPTTKLSYPHLSFSNGQSEDIVVTVERRSPEIVAISDDYQILSTGPIQGSRSNGFRANLEIDLLKALNLKQLDRIDRGETVRLRLGLFNRAQLKHSTSHGHEGEFSQSSGGQFYLFFDVYRANDKFIVEKAN